MKRETFGSRLGFILVSAGCAVGIGNVWKFPYMCGQFGGAAFILIYLVFLRMLFPDDVLYHSWWMDAVLLRQKLQRRFCGCGYEDCICRIQ